MSVNWIGPAIVTGVISETNCIIDISEGKNKNIIYHVNLMKPYFKRPEYLNLVIEEKGE